MRINVINKLLLVFALSSVATLAQAHEGPLKSLAGIVSSVTHLPSDAQKAALDEISTAKNASPAVQTMAQVMHDLQHNVTPADKVKLEAIVANPKASAAEKELASIIMGFMHNADDATKARLAKIH
jgi:hypothetical protein